MFYIKLQNNASLANIFWAVIYRRKLADAESSIFSTWTFPYFIFIKLRNNASLAIFFSAGSNFKEKKLNRPIFQFNFQVKSQMSQLSIHGEYFTYFSFCHGIVPFVEPFHKLKVQILEIKHKVNFHVLRYFGYRK